MSEEINQPALLASELEGFRAFVDAQAVRAQTETDAEEQREAELHTAEEELAAIRNKADGSLDMARTAFTEARGELRKTGRERVLDQTVEPQRKADAEPLTELDQYTRAVLRAAEGLTETVKDLVRWREAQARRRQVLIFAGIAVALAVTVVGEAQVGPALVG